MRIGIDASRAFVGERTGTENYSYQMIKHLLALPQAKNHEWILYAKPGANLKLSSNCKLKIVNYKFLWTQVGLAFRTWVDKLDVLWVPAHTLPVLCRPGLRTVVTIHGIEYEYLPAYENWLQRWYLPWSTVFAIQKASNIIAVSQFTANQLKEHLHADPQKLKVIYEGVERNSQIPNPKSQSVLKKYGLMPKKYILFIGTIQPRKNVKRLVEAFTRLKPQIPSLKLVLIGKLGWNYQDLPIDQDPQIKFLRYINDAERDIILQNALVYVQPSITEGFGLPILEAFAAGVPVASSHAGALPEVVGNAGLLFDPLRVEDIAEKLNILTSDEKLQSDLIARGKVQLTKFSWQKAAKETYNILIQNSKLRPNIVE